MTTLILIAIFTILSGLHIYWAFGGKWGLAATFPVLKEGKEIRNPGLLPTLIVALGLAAFALFYVWTLGWVALPFSAQTKTVIGWIIPSIFLLRAIGEFKYVGFFKRVKGSPFAFWDTRLFSPLCLLIAVLAMATILIH
jgi:hypothetical protein